MTCNEFKLWFQDHELDEMTGAIRSHLAVCDRCQKIFALDQKLETKLRNSLASLEVPPRLNERLAQNSFSHSRWRVKPHRIRRALVPALAMAAMLALVLFPFAWQESSFASMNEVAQLAIQDHRSHGIEGCSGSTVSDLKAWSLHKLGYSVTKPKVPEGAVLLAVSKCKLGDCETVHLMYSHKDKQFSVFIFPQKEADFSLTSGSSYSLEFGNYKVKLWQTGSQIQVMVT